MAARRTPVDDPSSQPRLRAAERTRERYRDAYLALREELQHARADAAHWRSVAERLQRSLAVRAQQSARRRLARLLPSGTRRREVVRRAGHRLRLPPAAPTVPTVPTVPMALQPEVSIIVPVHDQWAMTAACLRSIAEEPAVVGYEVIVVDDASSDATPDELARLTGVHVVRLDPNEGFLGAVNAGLVAARGRFVVLLNNDTVVRRGWLDALVETAESDPAIGVVGAKLVYPDGRLQEAGGIIYRDGTGHNYGRDQDPNDPRFNFTRDVDYCSGACLLVRRELVRSLGGLDQRFAPAYYEDTDLCFAARKAGYRVVFQPRAEVCHFEGASHGTDVSAGIKRFQEVNRDKFVAKWRDELAAQLPAEPPRVRLASWRSTRGRVVVVDHQLPMPDHESGSRRMSQLVGLLSELGFAVTFVPNNGIIIERYRDVLAQRGVEVLGGPGDLDRYLQDLGSSVRLAILSRPTVAWAVLPMFRSLAPYTPLVYDTVDLHFVREGRRAAVEGSDNARLSAAHHHGMETALVQLTDSTWVVSPSEREVLRVEQPDADVWVVPNIHPDEEPGPDVDVREGLLFVGNYTHLPNVDAARWMAQEIHPLVRKELGAVTLRLAGSFPTDEVRALASADVEVLGWVPDLADLYQRSRLFVAPLRYGAGMKGKIGESLAFGLPVVTTAVGAEGMGLTEAEVTLAPDDAPSFAAAVAETYRDRERWRELARNGRRHVHERFSPDAVRRGLAEAVDAVLARRRD
ncbi:MAG: glycosyltransferase [Acidimicrobiales bacterium]